MIGRRKEPRGSPAAVFAVFQAFRRALERQVGPARMEYYMRAAVDFSYAIGHVGPPTQRDLRWAKERFGNADAEAGVHVLIREIERLETRLKEREA